MTDGKPLKLRARDADDLTVISAMLQDAVVPVGEMTYLPREGRFHLLANRFRWEDDREAPAEGQIHERVHAALTFEGVRAVRLRGIDRRRRRHILSLLAVRATEDEIELIFSAGAALRLAVERISARLEDVGEPWPTLFRPAHELDADDNAGTGT